MGDQVTARSRYSQLEADRNTFLSIGRRAARLTLPALEPRTDKTSRRTARNLHKPWQSLGARGTNNLASKLLIALFPPNFPFFRYKIADSDLEEIGAELKDKGKVEAGLAKMERSLKSSFESSNHRSVMHEALKHLLVNGNVMPHRLDDGGYRIFHLDQYVVCRDGEGHLLEIVTVEVLDPDSLPDQVRKSLAEDAEKTGISETEAIEACGEEVHLYTWLRKDGKMWTVEQQVNDILIDGSMGSFPEGKLPYLPLRFVRVDGEDYGHGFVEEQEGDLNTLEILTQALAEAALAAARILYMVNPNSTTSQRDVETAENGAVVAGRAEDVSTLQLEKAADMRVALEHWNSLRRDLSFAFLMNTAVQRDAERVTAEEIREMIKELEEGLGGIFSLLSQELQLPLVILEQHAMEKAGDFPELPEEVKPIIVTGIEAIGRSHDLDQMKGAIGDIVEYAQVRPDVLMWLEDREVIERILTGRGVDKEGLIKDEETVQQMQQQQQLQTMLQSLPPEIGQSVQQALSGGGQTPPAGGTP